MGKVKQLLNNLIDKLFTKREWTEEDVNKYIGHYVQSYIAYSSDEQIRSEAASGGVVSAILIHCLDKGIIDGAVVCQSVIKDNKVRTKFYIARTKEEVLKARGSKYVTADFVKEAFPLIKDFEGRVAVVGLPCNLQLLTNRASGDPVLNSKIVLKIGLLCGHSSSPELIDHITKKLGKQENSRLVDYKFRIGTWRGKLQAIYESGKIIEKKTSFFNDYQNMYFFCERKCFYCNDHFAYHSDISVGDIWSYYLKENPVKHSGIIVRNEKAEELIKGMFEENVITGNAINISEILDGQSRGVRLHYNLTAKSKAGKLFGVKIPDKIKEKTKWHEYIVAFIVFFNWRWSRSKLSGLIFKIPKPLFKLYLYFMKGLQSL